MLSFESLDALRRQNKDLLMRLKDYSEKQQNLTSSCSTKEIELDPRDRDDDEVITKRNSQVSLDGKNGDPSSDSTLTVARGHSGLARAALCKTRTRVPNVKLSENKAEASGVEKSSSQSQDANTCLIQMESSEADVYNSLLEDHDNSRLSRHPRPLHKPILLSQNREQRDMGQVIFLSSGQEIDVTPERRRLQPLLGYDWIAGLLDAESSLAEHPEQFFTELHSFRQVNRDECVSSQASGSPVVTGLSSSPLSRAKTLLTETHKCTFCYRINVRLFATPLDPQTACPVCKMPKSEHPHMAAEPALIRVSVPRSALLPAYQYKAHRRSSFDPSDSLGLPSHCLFGWTDSVLHSGPQMSSLDLRSSMAAALTSRVPPPQTGNLNLSVSRVGRCRHTD